MWSRDETQHEAVLHDIPPGSEFQKGSYYGNSILEEKIFVGRKTFKFSEKRENIQTRDKIKSKVT